MPWGLQGFSSLTKDWTGATAVKAPCTNHWITRDLPRCHILNHCHEDLCLCFVLCFMILVFTVIFDPFWVNFCTWCEVRVQVYSFTCEYPVFPSPFVESEGASESHSVVSDSLRSRGCSPPGSSVHGILQQEYWSGLPFPSLGDLPDWEWDQGLAFPLALGMFPCSWFTSSTLCISIFSWLFSSLRIIC